MKLSVAQSHGILGWALVLLSASAEATHAHHRLHQHLDRRHTHLHARQTDDVTPVSFELEKRSTCQFPGDADPNLVAITPGEMNAGWAMSPDQPCKTDSYCPYACKPGMVMAQWDPDSSYTPGSSMNGGLYCDKNGEISKPFPSKPYCVEGTGSVKAVNKCGSVMSWCQTVLPGNEAMIIPTVVTDSATIAVPDPSYWLSTAAHFYINPPGVGGEGCKWGDPSEPIGNWSPFVAGANTDASGQTFVKLGWNPVFQEYGLDKTTAGFGVKIECPNGDCNGLPCTIDATKSNAGVESSVTASGAGGADFCVVTVPKGSTANIVAFTSDGGSDDGDEDDGEDEETSSPAPEPTTTSEAPPTTSEEPTTTSEPTTTQEPTTTSTTSEESTTSSPTPTTTSTTSSKSVKSTTTMSSPSPSSSSAKTTSHISVKPGIFHEHSNTTSTESSDSSATTAPSSDAQAESEEETDGEDNMASARQPGTAMVGLIVAMVAATYFF